MQSMEARPPYVTFETRSEEDREESIKQGRYVGKDVDYALITPAGSKDRIERIAHEWLPQTRLEVQAGRLPESWSKHYHDRYADYKAGREAPVNGTALADWPGLSPTQFKTLQSLGIRAVEDLAQANEETINRMGMGGRQLKQRAVDYLAAAANIGQSAEEVSALRAKLEDSQAREAVLREQMEMMNARLSALEGGQNRIPDGMPSSEVSGISVADILDDDQPTTRRL